VDVSELECMFQGVCKLGLTEVEHRVIKLSVRLEFASRRSSKWPEPMTWINGNSHLDECHAGENGYNTC